MKKERKENRMDLFGESDQKNQNKLVYRQKIICDVRSGRILMVNLDILDNRVVRLIKQITDSLIGLKALK